MQDGPKPAEPKREGMTAGALAMLIVIPLTLVLFGIDAVVLLHNESSYKEEATRRAQERALEAGAPAPDASPAESR